MKVYDSVRREVLYSILIVFGAPMKLVRLIKMCLSETCNEVPTCKLWRKLHNEELHNLYYEVKRMRWQGMWNE
jgi:hypothetical protein